MKKKIVSGILILAMGIVSSSQTSREWIGRNTLINFSLTVEYTPEDSDISYSWYDHDGPYDLMRRGSKQT